MSRGPAPMRPCPRCGRTVAHKLNGHPGRHNIDPNQQPGEPCMAAPFGAAVRLGSPLHLPGCRCHACELIRSIDIARTVAAVKPGLTANPTSPAGPMVRLSTAPHLDVVAFTEIGVTLS